MNNISGFGSDIPIRLFTAIARKAKFPVAKCRGSCKQGTSTETPVDVLGLIVRHHQRESAGVL